MVENGDRKKFIRFAAINLCICTGCYIVLIANGLTNTYDGMWKGSYYVGYSWVIQIGRWFWPIIGKARLNLSPEPFTSIASLLLFVVGNCCVAWQFGHKGSAKGYLVVVASTVNTTVCAMLSYRYMSPTFAFSYLFSILGVLVLREQNWKTWLLSVVYLTLSLGSYQANLGCACILVIFWVVHEITSGADWNRVIRFVVFALTSILFSCLLYKGIWDSVLRFQHIEASSYRGANDLSVLKMIRELPITTLHTYRVYYDYFFTGTIKHNVYQAYPIYKVGIILFFISVVIFMGIQERESKSDCILVSFATNTACS